MTEPVFRRCATCLGTGWVDWRHCTECRGTGKVLLLAPPSTPVAVTPQAARVEQLEALLRECLPVLDHEEGHGRALAQRIQEALDG